MNKPISIIQTESENTGPKLCAYRGGAEPYEANE